MMLKIGHRGASGAYPENTLLAFRQAVAFGANAVELDVHACASGEIVVIHDETLERTTNGQGRVDALSLADVKQLDAGLGERIPTLEETLAEFAPHITVLVEIKSSAAALPAARLISRFAAADVPYAHMPLIGFDAGWLKAAKESDPHILIGVTPDWKKPLDPAFCQEAKALKAWSVNPYIGHLHEAFVAEAHALDLRIITWTANAPHEIHLAKTLGVDGIISDYPQML